MSDALRYKLALPNDEDLDVFSTGDEEVDRYFRERRWFNTAKGKASPPTYQFTTLRSNEPVGYAAGAFQNQDGERFFVVFVVGIHSRFQSKTNPDAENTETFAVSLLRVLEKFAMEKPNCVGLKLRVRETNARAIGFYKKFGFQEVERFASDDRAGLVIMRKPCR